jgi:hypothetical protein
MPESDPTRKRLSRMEKHLSDIESMTRSILGFQGKEFKAEVLAEMASDDILKQVYLLVDGERSQADIAQELKGKTSSKTVQRKLSDLADKKGLITFVRRANPGGNIYRRSETDSALRIEQDL